MRQWLARVGVVGAVLVMSSAAWGQAVRPGVYQPRTLLEGIASTIVFGLIGIVLAIVGFKLFDLATPFSLESEICERQNIAVAIISGAMILGISIIIAVAVL
jgi:putative membrane protein